MNKFLGFLIVILLILGGIWYFSQDAEVQAPDNESMGIQDEDTQGKMEDAVMDEDDSSSAKMDTKDAQAKRINISGTEFSFSVKEIKVKMGDTVKIDFENAGKMPHDFVLDEFNARTAILSVGEMESIEFTATKKGTYEFYCSVGNHRAQGMVGKLIVE